MRQLYLYFCNLLHFFLSSCVDECRGIFVFLSVGDGCVYSWGRGILGRLGRGSEEDEYFPVEVKFENPNSSGDGVRIVGIAAGAYHSLALAGSKSSNL